MIARPKRPFVAAVVVGLLTVAAIAVLDWDLSALSSVSERDKAWGRITTFLGSFGAPDLSAGALRTALDLSLDTIAIALLGVALAAVIAWPLAILASRCVIQDIDAAQDEAAPLRQRGLILVREAARLVLDVLRGVPDFAWALLVYHFTGHGPATGILAIAISVAGILGKIYSELWDSADPKEYAALRATGASRLAVLFYGIHPLTARSMLSFTLMRTECAVRNASVIGLVGGGGIGAKLFEELRLDHYEMTVTLLLFTVALTASADLGANLLRRQFRTDPNHPRSSANTSLRAGALRRWVGLGIVGVVLGACIWRLREGLSDKLAYELARVQWGDFVRQYSNLLLPTLESEVWLRALRESVVPLALGWLVTIVSVGMAAAIAFPASVAFQLEPDRFTGERVGGLRRGLRFALFFSARIVALVMRAVPEVAWVMIFGHLFRLGLFAGFCGMVLHSAGVLARVFTETIDNVPYRRFEQALLPSRSKTFLWVGIPSSFATWKTYAMFQLEVNVRLGVVLGIVGIGGLGDVFHTAVEFWRLNDASVYLIAMVSLTVLLDRTSRWLHAHRVACRDV